jgi:hypothetical protein
MKSFFIIPLMFLFDVFCYAQSLPKVASGSIIRIEDFQSKYVKARNIDVWLPPGYSTSKKYKVIYMHEGQMLFDTTNTWNHQEWGVDETLGDLIEKRIVNECIVVAIPSFKTLKFTECFPEKIFKYIPTEIQESMLMKQLNGKVQGDNYLKFIVFELKPFIDSNFSTYTGVENTFMMGASIGGLISLYALCEYPNIFGGVACLSLHSPIAAFELINERTDMEVAVMFRNYLELNLPEANSRKIYFDYGNLTGDSLYKPYQTKIDGIMVKRGYTYPGWMTREFIGESHSENSWRKRLSIPFEFLLKNQ